MKANRRLIVPAALMGALFVASAARPASAADMVDNPNYLAWAQYKPGATVTFQGTLELGSLAGEAPTVVDQQVIYTLVNLGAEGAIVQCSTSVNNNGKWLTYPPQLLKIAAKTEKGTEGVLSTDDGTPDVKRELKDIQVTKGKIDLFGNPNLPAGQNNAINYDATIRDYTVKVTTLTTDKMETTITMRSKGWYVEGIPGGLARVESIGVGLLQTTTKLEVTAYAPNHPNNLPAPPRPAGAAATNAATDPSIAPAPAAANAPAAVAPLNAPTAPAVETPRASTPGMPAPANPPAQ